MSLHRRLTLFFVLIVMLPLAAAGFVVQRVVLGEVTRRAELALQPAINASLASYNARAPVLDRLVRDAVAGIPDLPKLAAANNPGPMQDALEKAAAKEPGVDFLIALERDGSTSAFVSEKPEFARDFTPPTDEEIARMGGTGEGRTASGPGFVTTTWDRPDRDQVGVIIGGFWVDRSLLLGAAKENVEISIVSGDQIVASTAGDPVAPPAQPVTGAGSTEVDMLGAEAARAQALPGEMSLVSWAPSAPIDALARRIFLSEIVLLLLALIVTMGLAYVLARLITRPLDDLTGGAKAIAEGRFDYRIPVRSRDEVGQLAAAFNDMTDQLEGTITELSSSRDQLQRAVRRVGETLRSTHDMRQILDSIVSTAADAVNADAGVLWTFTPTRDELYPALAVGTELAEEQRVRVGGGMVGLVAERGSPIVRSPETPSVRLAKSEPPLPVSMAIPFYSEDRISGVLALYRENDFPFSREDIDTVMFLAEQGGVAIENVFLHDEARRLSITDGLTGVWNRRYFQMQFRQVLATSLRFRRPFSIIMLDLDNFKTINDTYGHQRGDAILIEFAQRVSRVLREVDTYARYGGEEFIALLPETDVYGALTTAEKVREVIRSDNFGSSGEEPIRLTVSIGVASYPEHAETYKGLVGAADQALYKAKDEGRDRVRIAQKPPPPPLKIAK
jgi:two-component system, cell cycle response regulator